MSFFRELVRLTKIIYLDCGVKILTALGANKVEILLQVTRHQKLGSEHLRLQSIPHAAERMDELFLKIDDIGLAFDYFAFFRQAVGIYNNVVIHVF